ncbi:hypothetical protein ACOMHN_059947 [Nucella lapillus]
MVAITWVVPVLIFFTTIIGWQYFVGERTVQARTCEVQFMSDPLFTFLLTIGYYWIPLVVMCVLYGGIYKVALNLQRKSDAKQRKLQSTMELAADHQQHAASAATTKSTFSNSSDSDRSKISYFRKQRQKKKGGGGGGGGGGVLKDGETDTTCGTDHPPVRLRVMGHLQTPPVVLTTLLYDTCGTDHPPVRLRVMGHLQTPPVVLTTLLYDTCDDTTRSSISPGPFTHPHLPPPGRSPLHHHHLSTTPTSLTSRHTLGTGDLTRQNSLEAASSTLTDRGDPKDEDRSSSPAFASDEEGSSSGATPGAKSPKSPPVFPPHSSSSPRSGKSSLNPKVGIAGIVNTAMLTTPESFQRSLLLESHAIPSIIMDKPPPAAPRPPYSQVCPGVVVAAAEGSSSGTPMLPSGESIKSSHGGPNYSRLGARPGLSGEEERETDIGVDEEEEEEEGEGEERGEEGMEGEEGVPSAEEEEGCGAVTVEQVSSGCPYIDERSFQALTSREDTATLLLASSGDEDKPRPTNSKDSPLWKRRNSLPLPPLASEAFDIILDDDFTDLGVTEITMTTTMTSSKLNGGEDVPGEDTDHPTDGEGSSVPLNQNRKKQGGSTRKFTDSRRNRKTDGRLHSFVKSVRSRNSRRRNRRDRKSKSENRARKALRTITIILGAFVLCWTPYHIMLFVIAMCEGYTCINLGFYNLTYWLCYLNSPINPFCYAFANAQFKRTFLRILRFDWHRT